MRKYQHASNNGVLSAPVEQTFADLTKCSALPVTHIKFVDKTPAIISYWMPTKKELALLNSGRAVQLTIIGTNHAPVMLCVDGDGILNL